MKRKLVAAILLIALLVPVGSALAAQPQDEIVISPFLTYISTISPALTVSDKTATYSLYVKGTAGVTSISATLQLQQKNSSGVYVNYGTSWSASSSSSILSTSGTKTVASGYTYRLKVTVTAYVSGGSSTETAYS